MTVEEKIERLTGVVESVAESIAGLTGVVGSLAATAATHDKQIQALLETSRQQVEQMALLEKRWQAYLNTLRPV